MKNEHEVYVNLIVHSSSPRNSQEIVDLVRNYLVNELTGVYLLTEDEVDEVSFEKLIVRGV